MRFVFVDRILALEPGRSIVTLKNVSASEDIFDDHYPGHPVFPGALVLETFEQASQLLIASTHDFGALGRLVRIPRAAFRRFMGPGDQLRVRCERSSEAWTLGAVAECDGQTVATATLEFVVEPVASEPAHATAARLADLARVARAAPAAGDRAASPLRRGAAERPGGSGGADRGAPRLRRGAAERPGGSGGPSRPPDR